MNNLEKIKAILSNKFGINEEEITPETNLKTDIGADSLDFVEVMMEAEDEFGVEIPDEAAAEMVTVQDILNYIETK